MLVKWLICVERERWRGSQSCSTQSSINSKPHSTAALIDRRKHMMMLKPFDFLIVRKQNSLGKIKKRY